MRLTKRGEYALRALIDLGIAQEAGRELVQISEIADYEHIPIKFLEAILVDLKELGFLESKRGKHGGYFLARPMDSIMLGTVIRKVEGPLAPIGCVSQNFYEKCSCPDEDHCGLRMLMLDVRNAIADILDKYSLAQVVEITLRKMRRDKVPLPFTKKSSRA
jgi:Rrf2 family protein